MVKRWGGRGGAVALAVAIASTGCAVVMKQAPAADREPSDPPVCSTGRGGVALDTLIGVVLGVGAATALSEEEGSAAFVLAAGGTAFIASAVSGHRAANQCEEAVQSFQLHQEAMRAEAREGADPEPGGPPGVRFARTARPPAPPPSSAPPPPPPAPAAAPPVPPHGADPAPTPAPAPVVPEAEGDWRDFWIEVAP